jgi:hypothetical protein
VSIARSGPGRVGAFRLWLGLSAAVVLPACWVEQVHIEPDGWDADDADAGTDGVTDDGAEETADVPSECGNGIRESGEECDGDPPASCVTTCGSPGQRACGADCRWAAACAVPAEACNGADDDCDGATDEDFGCVAGETRPCSDGACGGAQTCRSDVCEWTPCGFGPAPINDGCAGATDISAGGVFEGDTCGASDDHAPAATCSGGGGRDLWYTFTLTGREVVYLDTVDGRVWDTVLQLRWGSCPGAGSPVVCSDDACPGESGGRRSQVLEVLDAGTYFVVVDGGGAAEAGPFALRFQHAGCGDARVLPGSGNYDGTTSGRGDSFAGSCGGASTPDVMYYFGLCAPRTVTATTCNAMSGFDSVLSLMAGGCSASDEVACNDDDPACGLGVGRSTVTADLPQGLNFLVVDGRRGGPGPYRVNVSGL